MPTVSNNTSHINIPIKGMVQDMHLMNTGEQFYTFALNAMVADYTGNQFQLQNEPSNVCSVKFPLNYRVVGKCEVPEQNRTIYMLVNPITGMSQIGEVLNCNIKDRTDKIEKVYCKDCNDNYSTELTPLEKQTEQCYCEYHLTTQSICLGFNINHPIDIEYRITSCGLYIYFTDDLNERRFAYFDYTNNDPNDYLILQDKFKVSVPGPTPGDPCNPDVILDEIDCNKIKVHPDYQRVCVEFVDYVSGGNLKAGSYQVLLGYSDAYGNIMSNIFPSTQIIPLYKKPITLETNYSTSSALHFKVLNLSDDLLYKYYTLIIAETIDGFTEFKQIGVFPTTQTEYTYTGFETTIKKLSPQEVLFRYPYYKTAKAVTKANNYLFYSSVKSYKKLNLQPVANQVKLNWMTVALKEGAYANPRNTFWFRSEQRDEVVPYGIIFEYSNGEETCAFHIPGRASVPSDLTLVPTSSPDYINDINCATPASKPKWKIYNTGTVLGGDHQYDQNCETDKCWEYGNFSYWESTETYPQLPDVWGDLCGMPIRHHKFPDSCVTHIHDSGNGAKVFKDNNYIFPIGVTVDHQSVITAIAAAVTAGTITQDDADRIVSYRIVRGNRLGQKSIVAKGLLYNMWFYDKNGKRYFYPNYAYNDLRADYFIAPAPNYNGSNTSNPVPVQPDHVDTSRFTFHSPDTHFVQPELGSYLKLETEEYGQSEGYFTYSDCQAKYKLLSTFARALAFGLGLAEAISATGQKECHVIHDMADYKINQDDSTWNNLPWSHVTGSWTSAGGSISTSQGTGPTDATVDHGEITEHHNTDSTNYFNYNNQLGTPTAVTAAGFDTNTCKGMPYQLFNTNGIIGTVLAVVGAVGVIIQRALLAIVEMDRVLETFKALIPFRNYGIQYDSAGVYNNYKCVNPGNKLRNLSRTAYLEPIMQAIVETSTVPNSTSNTVFVNNWHRESSVYLKTGGNALAVPSVIDNSRVTMDNIGFGYGDLNRVFNRSISSFYVSVKRDIPNQYGSICSIDYLETNHCSFFLDQTYNNCASKVFGGDTFINRFSLKRKMPFFIQTRCGLPNGSDVVYTDLINVGFPNYFFNSEQPLVEKLGSLSGGPLTILQDVLGTADSRMDAKTNKAFYQNGYIHLFNYGVPSFIVESDVNLDYRHGENLLEKDFYPHNTDLKTWFEEANVPIKFDNYYFYNRTYSKQNHETPICTSCIRTLEDITCDTHNDNLVIYSEPTDFAKNNDNWLVFKANNFYNFPLSLGKLITIDGIESDKVLARLENSTQIFAAYNTIQTDADSIQVGTGGIFASRPKEYATTDLGYAGTQHRDILHTEFGHLWGDAKRGQFFNLGNGGGALDEITKDGMSHWFKENLPFQLKRDFPQISQEDLDNNFKGIGLHYCYDRKFSRILVTKLDYKRVNPDVLYNTTTHEFYTLTPVEEGEPIVTIVSLSDPRYFCNKSWTVSYNFFTKTWTSYHSYKPNYYVEHIDGFESSTLKRDVNNTTYQYNYLHNASNKSYQVFYGKLEPFIVEVLAKQSIDNNFITSFEYLLDVVRYHNEFDAYYVNNVSFNKAIVYNERQCSGVLNLIVNNHNDQSLFGKYPNLTDTGYEILTTNSENVWRFNKFYDFTASQNNNMPFFIYDCANVSKTVDNRAMHYNKSDLDLQRIRQRMCRIRLINDKHSNYKMIFNFSQMNQNKSFR